MKKLVLLIILLVGIYSCIAKEKKFPNRLFESEQKLNGEIVELNFLLGNPGQIVFVDSLLMIQEDDGEYLIKFVDPKKGLETKSICRIGRGPGEFSRPIEINYNKNDKTVDVYERSSQRVSHLNINADGNIDTKKISFVRDSGYVGFVRKCKDLFYVGVGAFNNRYAIFNANGVFLKTKYDYPQLAVKEIENDLLYNAYQNKLEINECNDMMVAVSTLCDNIEFFKIEEGDIDRIKKYEFNKPDFIDESASDRKILHPSKKNRMGYLDICSDKDHVYCLYSGRAMKDYTGRSGAGMGEYIFVFDWFGNPVTSYKLDRDIFCFTVDSNERTIYAITHSPEPNIVKYSY